MKRKNPRTCPSIPEVTGRCLKSDFAIDRRSSKRVSLRVRRRCRRIAIVTSVPPLSPARPCSIVTHDEPLASRCRPGRADKAEKKSAPAGRGGKVFASGADISIRVGMNPADRLEARGRVPDRCDSYERRAARPRVPRRVSR